MHVIIPYEPEDMTVNKHQSPDTKNMSAEITLSTTIDNSPGPPLHDTSHHQEKKKKHQPILMFQAAKKLYLDNINNCQFLDEEIVKEMRCLLVDSDPTIAKEAIRVLIGLMQRFGKQAADMILELGFAKLPLEGNFFIFAPPPFDVSLEFLAKFCRYHPQFFADNFTILKKYLESAFLTHEPTFMLLGFDIIDTMAEFQPRVLLEGKIREDLLKVLAVEKHNSSMVDMKTKQEEQFLNSTWSIFFTMQEIHAEPMDKHLFSRCLHSLIHLCKQLNKIEDPKVAEFFFAICQLLLKNPLKCVYPQLCLQLLSVMIDNAELAEIIGPSVMELSKNGLCHVDDQIRAECCALFLKVKNLDTDIQALEQLIRGLNILGADEEIIDVDIYKYLSPIKALGILAEDPLTAMMLMILHVLPNLFDMLRVYHHHIIQYHVLELIIKIASHTNVHANRFSKSGHLEEFLLIKLKIPKENAEMEASKLFGEGFVKILLKCSDPHGILSSLKRCRYVAGRSAMKFHIVHYLNNVEEFTAIVKPEFIEELKSIEASDRESVNKWVDNVTRHVYFSQEKHEVEHNRFIRLKTPHTENDIPLIKAKKHEVVSKAPKNDASVDTSIFISETTDTAGI